ncbi:unnamed protein product [Cuscuta europaea]|uniref:Sister chromatid cohesion 1 protein 1 n=1 Tax=Cuscuta europaea TaxID=41803 RepID=A0A9P0ZW98_CUSEU|nr:unnamed protein product [Cuscuta europaea]
MFFSHQILARKLPMGQIWLAANSDAKMTRRQLAKLNIVQICEEILNPPVPLALRMSGILMGGVVKVYQHKVKFLYDDVNRLMVEVNRVWKVNVTLPDPTQLPKKKEKKAKNEAVTLEEERDKMMFFLPTTNATMCLEDVEIPFINVDLEDCHQADAADITLGDHFDSHREATNLNSRFERFDIEGDEETQPYFDDIPIPCTLIPSPPEQHNGEQKTSGLSNEVLEQHPEDLVNQQSDDRKGDIQQPKDQERPRPPRRRARKAAITIDNQTVVLNHIYKDWLGDCSDIVSRRGSRKQNTDAFSKAKVIRHMELPPHVLMEGLFTEGSREVYYPKPLLDLWMSSIQPASHSAMDSGSQPFEPSSSEHIMFSDHSAHAFEDFQSGGSQRINPSMEKRRGDFTNIEVNLSDNIRVVLSENNILGNEATDIATTSGSPDTHFSMSSRKRSYSSNRPTGIGLETVAEDYAEPDFKMTRLSDLPESDLNLDNEILIETGPTQMEIPNTTLPVDEITDSIRGQLKTHFDAPGAPKVESLNDLTAGMSRKEAACMFFQTCVLASQNFIKVEQREAYDPILISRGADM